jgi:hypothetical protein
VEGAWSHALRQPAISVKKPAIENHVADVSQRRLKITNPRLQTRFGMTSCAVNSRLRFQISNLML